MIFALISSMSRALRAENGRLMPRRETIGSSIPSMVTTKLPLPGFSLLISTTARSPTALAILLDRDLNAPHCLQASTVTTFFPLESDLDDVVVVASVLVDGAGASFAGASFAGASFAGASFAGASFAGASFGGASFDASFDASFVFFTLVVVALVLAVFAFLGGAFFGLVCFADGAFSDFAASEALSRADLLVPTMMNLFFFGDGRMDGWMNGYTEELN